MSFLFKWKFDYVDEFFEHGRLDHLALVETARHFVEVYGVSVLVQSQSHSSQFILVEQKYLLDIVAQLLHKAHIDVGLDQGSADLFQHVVQGLFVSFQ